MKRYTLVLTVLLVLMAGQGSCAPGDVSNQQGIFKLEGIQGIAGQDQSSSANTVTIQDFSFQPSTLTVPKGTTVTWHNQGVVDHTVTSDTNGMFDSRISPGKEFSFSFSAPGTYNYHCSIHTSMHGTIVVTGSAVSAVSASSFTGIIKGDHRDAWGNASRR